jgi:hypothetical protein
MVITSRACDGASSSDDAAPPATSTNLPQKMALGVCRTRIISMHATNGKKTTVAALKRMSCHRSSIVIALFVLQSCRTLRRHRPLPQVAADPAAEETEDVAVAFVSPGVDLSQLKLNIA